MGVGAICDAAREVVVTSAPAADDSHRFGTRRIFDRESWGTDADTLTPCFLFDLLSKIRNTIHFDIFRGVVAEATLRDSRTIDEDSTQSDSMR